MHMDDIFKKQASNDGLVRPLSFLVDWKGPLKQ